mgnify:CR=1 FL=1
MPLGYMEVERRERRQALFSFLRNLALVLILAASTMFAYQLGIEQVKARDTELQNQAIELTRQRDDLLGRLGQAQNAIRASEAKVAELEARLLREVPSGELARLNQLLTERLASGVEPNRLAYVITSLPTQRACQSPETKRFVLPVPGKNNAPAPPRPLTLASGIFTLTGEGKGARNPQGRPENWFDPAQPVNLKIVTVATGKDTLLNGVLPLHYSAILDGIEYRFTFSASARSYVEVLGDRCAFP